MSQPHRAPDRDWPGWPASWIGALVFFVTLVAYWPALNGELLWDDAGHVTRPDLQSFEGLGRIWFEVGATQQYYPLLHTAFWLEHRLWGDATVGYHVVNVLLHALAAVLVGTILRRLSVRGAWLAALFFALHPVCVESVAWISEQKNTLSTVLYLAAGLTYLRFAREGRRSWYAVASVLFVLALLTKSVTATLPAALLVAGWFQRGRISWRRDVVPLVPWFALGAGAGLMTAWVERTQIGAEGGDFALSLLQRCLLAGRIIWFYLGKLLWPADLSFIYPRWTVDSGRGWQYVFPIAAVATLAGLWRWRDRNRGPLAALLFFVGTLFPALGFVNVFPFVFSFVADHFQYVAAIGIYALVASGLTTALARISPMPRHLSLVTLLLILGALTWHQSAIYRDLFALYETTLERNPACWMAHNNLAIALVDAGRATEAIPHYEKALQYRPDYTEAENNFGYALNVLGRPAEALPHLQRALQLNPRYAEAHNNLGVALMGTGHSEEGRAEFARAVQLKPDYALGHFNLGLALATANRAEEAIPRFRRAVELDPNYAEAELNWGIGLTVTGHVTEALPHFERAVSLKPDVANAHNFYGRALAAAGQFDQAISQYQVALQLDPTYAEAHFNLALALQRTGRNGEAAQHFAEATRLGWKS